jgi:hypothetical protein
MSETTIAMCWNRRSSQPISAGYGDPQAQTVLVRRPPPARWHVVGWEREQFERMPLRIAKLERGHTSDHSAILVADTAPSVAFYQQALGFSVAGGSLNRGQEQEQA